MLLVAGIDPGRIGAVGVYDLDSDKLIMVYDLPNFPIVINGHTRTHLDTKGVKELFSMLAALGVKLIVLEKVQGYGGRKQSASAGFQFGDTYGVIRTRAEDVCHIELASPAVWKLREKVPADEKAIVKLADTEFPEHAHLFHGPKGGSYHDRAEAAFLARYAARSIWPIIQPRIGLRVLIDQTVTVGLDGVPGLAAAVSVAKPIGAARSASTAAKKKRKPRKRR